MPFSEAGADPVIIRKVLKQYIKQEEALLAAVDLPPAERYKRLLHIQQARLLRTRLLTKDPQLLAQAFHLGPQKID